VVAHGATVRVADNRRTASKVVIVTSQADPRTALRLVELRESPLDVTEVLDSLADATAGGLTLFVGRVRDHDGGHAVDGLDYSAHPTALERLREVCERVAAEHDVQGLAAVHRTGALAIGDIAVIVATASAHRDEAFRATRALIDTLKAEVPIWKHQRFSDGTDEWVGTP
jgi:molybdopterin synthase catalytic subunit